MHILSWSKWWAKVLFPGWALGQNFSYPCSSFSFCIGDFLGLTGHMSGNLNEGRQVLLEEQVDQWRLEFVLVVLRTIATCAWLSFGVSFHGHQPESYKADKKNRSIL
jgi:hypothetical protein